MHYVGDARHLAGVVLAVGLSAWAGGGGPGGHGAARASFFNDPGARRTSAAPSAQRGDSVVELKAFGAVGDGNHDDTQAWLSATAAANREHKRLHVPAGTYVFNGKNLPWESAPIFDSGVVVKNQLYSGIIQQDADGRVIGLQQNLLEAAFRPGDAVHPIETGNILPAPVADSSPARSVDVIAHWYNDFGLTYTLRGSDHEWIGWYTWQWNHHDNKNGFDPSRQPLLGWYRGDDPRVLDWICYWLVTYGVAGVALVPSDGVDTTTWQDAGNRYYWLYQLFNNVKNFDALTYQLYMQYRGSPDSLEAGWSKSIAVYLRYPHFYKLHRRTGDYPAVFVWEGEMLRGALDHYNGSRATADFLARVADRFRAAGYAGVAVFARHATATGVMNRDELASRGVLYLDAEYDGRRYSHGATYQDLIANWQPPQGPRASLSIPTSTCTKPPHPSHWRQCGQTPELFGGWLRTAVQVARNRGLNTPVFIYNVSEWAEGGPGLIPNMQDRFGYLEQVRSVVFGR